MQKKFWYIIGCLVVLIAGAWLFLTVAERTKPSIDAGPDATVIGRQKTLQVTFSDSGRGLRHTEIAISQNKTDRVLSAVDYPETGVHQKTVSAAVDAVALKLNDGPADLILTAVDHSLCGRTGPTEARSPSTCCRADLPAQHAKSISIRRRLRRRYHLSEAVPDDRRQVAIFSIRAIRSHCRETRLRGLFRAAHGRFAGRPANPDHGLGPSRKRTAGGIPSLILKRDVSRRHHEPLARLPRSEDAGIQALFPELREIGPRYLHPCEHRDARRQPQDHPVGLSEVGAATLVARRAFSG